MRELRHYPWKYEKSVKPDSWEGDYMCMAQAKILLPYYFSPNEGLQNDSAVNDLFGKMMYGIDNEAALTQKMGLKMSLIDLGLEKILDFNRRVWPQTGNCSQNVEGDHDHTCCSNFPLT